MRGTSLLRPSANHYRITMFEFVRGYQPCISSQNRSRKWNRPTLASTNRQALWSSRPANPCINRGDNRGVTGEWNTGQCMAPLGKQCRNPNTMSLWQGITRRANLFCRFLFYCSRNAHMSILTVRSNSSKSNGLKSRPGSCPYALVV